MSFLRKRATAWIVLLLIVVCVAIVVLRTATIHKGSDETVGALYWDQTLSVEERVDDLLSRMTTDEKIGQLALVEKNSLLFTSDIERFHLGVEWTPYTRHTYLRGETISPLWESMLTRA